MSNNQKLNWLKQILAVKVALTLLAWGLPALLAPMSVFRLLGVPTPDDLLFVRLFGAVVTAVGVAYWYGSTGISSTILRYSRRESSTMGWSPSRFSCSLSSTASEASSCGLLRCSHSYSLFPSSS